MKKILLVLFVVLVSSRASAQWCRPVCTPVRACGSGFGLGYNTPVYPVVSLCPPIVRYVQYVPPIVTQTIVVNVSPPPPPPVTLVRVTYITQENGYYYVETYQQDILIAKVLANNTYTTNDGTFRYVAGIRQ